MHHNFYENISQFRCTTTCYFSTSMRNKMIPSFMPGTFSEINLTDVLNTLKEYLQSLKHLPYVPHEYFDEYLEQMFYEIILDIYDKTAPGPETGFVMREKIDKYINQISPSTSPESLEQQISQKKKIILDEYKKKSSATLNTNKNHPAFYQNIIAPLGNHVNTSLNDIDFIFIIQNYTQTIFHHPNIDTGIDIYNLYGFVSTYLGMHPNNNIPDFKTEYSAFLFNQMFSAIQFEEGISTLLSPKDFRVKFPNSYWPLHLFTRMYDTPYLSLSDYILKKYPNIVTGLYSNEEVFNKNLYFEIQQLKSFWIPLCHLVIEETLFTCAEGNLEKISFKCQNYIETCLVQGQVEYSYFKRLHSANAKIPETKYPFKRNVTERESVIAKAPKTATFEQRINYSFSQCLYNQHQVPFILIPNYYSYTQDALIEHIELLYNTAKDYYKTLVLETANETLLTRVRE